MWKRASQRLDRLTLRRKWSSANLFPSKTGKLPPRSLLQRDGSLLIVSISFSKWPPFFISHTSSDWTYKLLQSTQTFHAWFAGQSSRIRTRSFPRYFQRCAFIPIFFVSITDCNECWRNLSPVSNPHQSQCASYSLDDCNRTGLKVTLKWKWKKKI